MDLENTYNGKTVLITGHTGFKGSWLSLWLRSLGANIIGYARPPETNPSLYHALKTYNFTTDLRGTVENLNQVSHILQKYKPDFIFHLAAQPIVRKSYIDPIETMRTNVNGTIAVLEAIRLSNYPTTGIFITSDKCYENKEWDYAYRENDALGGHDPYSASKAMAELAIKSYNDSFFNIDGSIHAVASARAGNIIGGGDWSQDRIVTDCIISLVNKKPIILRNPGAIRPWQFVLDALYGYLLLGSKLKTFPRAYSGAWNFGPSPENNIPVHELAHRICKGWGSGKIFNSNDVTEKHEATYLKLDSTKSMTVLGWVPRYNVDQAIKNTTDWYKYYYNQDKKDMQQFTLDQITNWHETFNR